MSIPTMSYVEGRNLIKDGDIIFIAYRHTISSAIIRFFTRSIYSHCNMAFWEQTQAGPRLLVVEAQSGTTRRIINLSFYETLCDLHVVSPPKDWNDVAPVALQQLGLVKYSYIAAIYVGLREFLLKYLNIKIKEQKMGEICSEFVARCNQLTDEQISPGMLMQELNNLGYPIKLIFKRIKI